MRKSKKLGSYVTACLLNVLILWGCLSASVFASEVSISAETDLSLGANASLVDNNRGQKAIHINTSWVDTKAVDALEVSASFKNPNCFQKTEFTLFMDVYRLENGGNAGDRKSVV